LNVKVFLFLMSLLFVFQAVAYAEPVDFRVGRAMEKITPPVGTSLAGYFHDRRGETVRDDLYARAMVVGSGDTRVALVSCDLISMTSDVSGAAKRVIETETGIPADHVLICSTHTHTGPELRDGSAVAVNTAWRDALPRHIADAVARAAAGAVPATLRAGATEVTGYSFNRLFRLKDGSEVFGKGGRENEVVGLAGPIDPTLQTLSAVDKEGNVLAVIVNFALHADVIGGGSADFISADWPGMLGTTLSAVYGPDMVTLMLQGTCGDINHCTHDETALPTGGPKKVLQLGHALAGAAMLAMERAEPMTDAALGSTVEMLKIPYYTRDEKFLARMEELKKMESPSDFDRSIVERGEAWTHDGQMADVPIQVMRIGKIGLAAFPAEIFVEIGLEVKRWSPADATFVVELSNALVSGYVPTPDKAERGGYGEIPILSRWLHADAGRYMADSALRQLQGAFAATPAAP